jgi:CheY-like chemotaxis protein
MAGHAVQVAASGREAMALLETGSFDLIVSDLRMPDLDGPGLHRHLRQHRPELLRRLIFITGDVLSADYDGMIAQDGITVLEKPIDLAALSTLVAQLLSAGSEP